MSSQLLWFANRGTGIVLLALMTLTVILGIWSSTGKAGRGLPQFVTQHLHRNVGLMATGLLAVHVTSAVVDTYVHIRWMDALVPFVGAYKPFYLGLGTLTLDLMIALVVTSLLRHRLPERLWRGLHLLSYAAWGVSVIHGLGIGTDAMVPWSWWFTLGCVAAVAMAWLARTTVPILRTVRA